MPPNRKRPVTYGKSPLNRLQPHAPAPESPTGPSTTRISPVERLAAAVAPSPKSSVRPLRPSCPAENPPGTSPSQPEGESERKSMQRKRRKLSPEEPSRNHIRSQKKSTQGTNSDGDPCYSKATLSSIHPYHHDPDQKRSGTPRSSRSGTSSENDLKAATPTRSQYWRPIRRQKPTSQSQDYGRTPKIESVSTPKKHGLVSTRKRLVDLLGTTDEDNDVHTTALDDASGSAHISNSVDDDELRSTLTRRESLQIMPESGMHSHDHNRGDSSVSIPPILRSSGVTYSRQRSYLNDSTSLIDREPHGVRRPYGLETERAPRPIGFSCLLSEEDEIDTSKPVRSIHELRQAGDNARFREVVDSMFEDFESPYSSRSERCCGLAELCEKLLNSQFAHRFSEQGFDERLVNCTSDSLDIASAFLALSAYKLILCGGHASRPFFESSWARILEISPPLLDIEDDLLVLMRDSSMGLSKTAQASMRGLRSHLPSFTGSESPCLSPQLLALECMKSSLIVLRDSGHIIRPMPLSLLRRLVNLMEVLASSDLHESSPADDFHLLDLVFSILENYSVISEFFDNDHFQCFQRLSQLHDLLTLDYRDSNRGMSLSYIRVVLNLTNREPTLCDNFAVPAIVSNLARIVIRGPSENSRDVIDKESGSLDEVILALGALINLSENTRRSRDILIESDGHAAPFLRQLLEQFSARVTSIDQVR
ncbi:hypothetical protein BDV06DRAFT_191163 [Aspergillus oleicola]